MSDGTAWEISGPRHPVSANEISAFGESAGFPLPEALRALYADAGPGTYGGFLHILPPSWILTHRERVGPLLGAEDEPEIAATADVLVFATTDNGDLIGWHAEQRPFEDRVVRLVGFDEIPLGLRTGEFLRALGREDLFGVGRLSGGYVPSPEG
ncbi:SMI1/KNR4 family protein [Streptomyces sp. NPDC004609]|uniref:SMI1/KNR4 family protein n=1 Tax=Streptomyces sp. NPDC004609 TaxID=3364704 RepID=UPI0036785A9B